MKKLVFLFAMLLLVTSLLIGCGGGSGSNNTSNSSDDKINALYQTVTAVNDVSKKAEDIDPKKVKDASPVNGSRLALNKIFASEEPEGEHHGARWTGPDADGWYSTTVSIAPQFIFEEYHSQTLKMKIQDASTTLYKVEDTTTLADGTLLGKGVENTTFTKGADNLCSGSTTYVRYYRTIAAVSGTANSMDYKATVTESFTNVGTDGTGHFESQINLVSTTVNEQGDTIKNDLSYKNIFDVTYNADKTKLEVDGTTQAISGFTGIAAGPVTFHAEWDLFR